MIKKLYSYYDTELGTYDGIIEHTLDPETMKQILLREIIKQKTPKEIAGKKLYYLGSYDDEKGIIEAVQPDYLLTMPEKKEDPKDENKK